MSTFRTGDAVEVISLQGPGTAHLLPGFATRPPEIGDVGVVVRARSRWPRIFARRYVVEGGSRGAAWAWLAEFSAAELAPTRPPL